MPFFIRDLSGTVEAVQTGGVQELDAIQHLPQQPTGLA